MNFRSTIIFLLLISRVSADDRCMVLSRVPNDQQCTVRVHDDASKCGTYADRIDTELRCRDSPHLSEFACVCDVDDEDCPNATPGILDMLLEQITVLELFSDKVNPLHACLSSAVVQYADRESAPKVSTEASGPVGSHLDSSSSPTEEVSSTTSVDVPSAETSSPLSQSTEHHLSTQSHGPQESSTVRRLSEESGETPEKQVSAESSSPAVPPSAPPSESASTLALTSPTQGRSREGVTTPLVQDGTSPPVDNLNTEVMETDDQVSEPTTTLYDNESSSTATTSSSVGDPQDYTLWIILAIFLIFLIALGAGGPSCFFLLRHKKSQTQAKEKGSQEQLVAMDVLRLTEEGLQQVPHGSVAATSTAASPASSPAPSPAAASPAAAPPHSAGSQEAAVPAAAVAPPATRERRGGRRPRRVRPPGAPKRPRRKRHATGEHRDNQGHRYEARDVIDRGSLTLRDYQGPMDHARQEEADISLRSLRFDLSQTVINHVGSFRENYTLLEESTQEATEPTQ